MTKPSDLNINWNEIQENDFKPLQPGVYAGKVIEAELKDSKAGGKYLNLKFSLLGPKGIKNRTVYDICMLSHSNPEVVTIGARKIKTLADLTELEVQEMDSFSEFIGKPVGLKLGIQNSDTYGDKNVIKKYMEFSEDLLQPESTSSF